MKQYSIELSVVNSRYIFHSSKTIIIRLKFHNNIKNESWDLHDNIKNEIGKVKFKIVAFTLVVFFSFKGVTGTNSMEIDCSSFFLC